MATRTDIIDLNGTKAWCSRDISLVWQGMRLHPRYDHARDRVPCRGAGLTRQKTDIPYIRIGHVNYYSFIAKFAEVFRSNPRAAISLSCTVGYHDVRLQGLDRLCTSTLCAAHFHHLCGSNEATCSHSLSPYDYHLVVENRSCFGVTHGLSDVFDRLRHIERHSRCR